MGTQSLTLITEDGIELRWGTIVDGDTLVRSGTEVIGTTPTAADVVGPASATDNAVARFDGTTGKLIQNSAVTIDDSGNIATAGTVDGVDVSVLGAAAVAGPGSATDNAICRFDGTTGKLIQNSAVTVDDTTGTITLPSTGLVDGVDVSAIGFAGPESQRVWASNLNRSGAAKLLITNTGYFVYVGRTVNATTPKFVEFHVSTIGSGAQTAEVGLFSTPLAPNKAAQTLTKLVATSTVDALTSLGVKRNTSAFATSVPAGTHLWAGIRTAMATSQPTIEGLNFDMAQGQIQTATTPGALTGAGPFTGVLVAASLHGATSDVPDLRVTLD